MPSKKVCFAWWLIKNKISSWSLKKIRNSSIPQLRKVGRWSVTSFKTWKCLLIRVKADHAWIRSVLHLFWEFLKWVCYEYITLRSQALPSSLHRVLEANKQKMSNLQIKYLTKNSKWNSIDLQKFNYFTT